MLPLPAANHLSPASGPAYRPLNYRNSAPLRARFLVATAIGFAGALIAWLEFFRSGPGHHSDFSPLWYSARALLAGQDPYVLIGPGRPFDFSWPAYYPATAFVAAMPFAWLPEATASAAFVGISTFMLALGVTRDGWYRLPLFLSVSYVMAARASELSPLLAAALLFPPIAALYPVKPNLGMAFLAASTGRRPFLFAAVGFFLLLVPSLWLLPSWPRTWFRIVSTSTQHDFPIAQWGGPLVLLALLRWRHWQSWLVVSLACIPQTVYWYEGLYLLLIPATYRQSLVLSFVSTMGFLLERTLVGWQPIAYRYAGEIMIFSLYIPAVWMLLLRSAEGEPPAWLSFARGRLRGRAGVPVPSR